MSFKILFLTLIISVALCGSYEKDGNVLILNNENIDEALEEFDHIFIKFFAPWCDHCKEMANDWREAADMLIKRNIAVAELDCTVDHPNASCGKYVSSGYPTLKYFAKKRKEPLNFDGQRQKHAFLKFAQENQIVSQEVKGPKGGQYEQVNGYFDLNEYNYNKAINEFQYVFVQYYKSCPKCSVFEQKWKRLAKDLTKSIGDQLILARVDCDEETELCQNFNEFPRIVIFKDGVEHKQFNGKKETKALLNFAESVVQKNDL